MKTAFKSFDHIESYGRINEILDTSDNSFEERRTIPSEDTLTYTNGFYVNCSALFIDIRGSSNLTDDHRRPKLAKLYRAYVSEVVAVLSGNRKCKRIDIVGDGISAIFETPLQSDIDDVFATAYTLNSAIRVMNVRFAQRDIKQITVGIGLAYGRALMIKAGFKSSGINDVIWMGDVVNRASQLCSYGSAGYGDKTIMVDDVFYDNLNDQNKSLLERNYQRSCYHGEVVSKLIDDWLQQQTSRPDVWRPY